MKFNNLEYNDGTGLYVSNSVETKNFKYSDGDIHEKYIFDTLTKAKDLSSSSLELANKIKDWPSRYHLSPLRSNLFRIFSFPSASSVLELGSGMGALTRYLGEYFEKVDAVEGSMRRALASRQRTIDLKSVNVYHANFNDLDFDNDYDITTLIGVLEYAPLFDKSAKSKNEACLNTLLRTKQSLKTNGALVIAIENKLGLKYWSGATEDHTNSLHEGIYGYPQSSGPITFTEYELRSLLKTAGFNYQYFIYTFPDYKLPTTFFSERTVKLESYLSIHNWLAMQFFEDYSRERAIFLHDQLAARSLSQDNILHRFSNSFIVVASQEKNETLFDEPNWYAKKVNTLRSKGFQTITSLKKKSNNFIVSKKRVYPSAKLNSHRISIRPITNKNFERGELFVFKWYESIVTGFDLERFTKLVLEYRYHLLQFFSTNRKNNQFFQVKGNSFDFTPWNIIINKNKWAYIDDEWELDFELPEDFILFRSLFQFLPGQYRFLVTNKIINIKKFNVLNLIFDIFLSVYGNYNRERLKSLFLLEQQLQIYVQTPVNDKKIEKILEELNATKTIEKPFTESPKITTNKSNEPLVSIVIPIFNQLKYTKQCLQSIIENTKSISYEVILIDNGSSDGTILYFENEFPGAFPKIQFHLIKNKINKGFAGGNNQGIAAARGDLILLMNNDIVVTPGWLEKLMACMQRHPLAAIVGPKSNYVSGPQQVKTVAYDLQSLSGLDEYAKQRSFREHGKDKRLIRVVGFCMLIKRDVIEKIGGMDTRYGLGNFEDDDFSLRAALAGFESWMAEDCFVHHFGSRTFIGEKIDYKKSLNQNWRLFKKKWGLPENLPYGSGYRLKNTQFTPEIHYVPLIPVQDGKSLSFGNKSSDGGTIEALYSEAQSLLKNNQDQQAVKKFERLLELNPSLAVAHNDLGVLYFRMGYKDKALKQYHAANRLDPDNMNFKKNLADFYCIELGKIEEAIQLYVEILEVAPDDTETMLAMGHICRLLGKNEEASSFYSSVLRVDGSNEEAIKILHLIDAEVSSPIESPSDETLYSALMKNAGEEDPAATIKKMESFLSDFPDHAKAHNDIGMLYYHIQNKEKAKLHLEKAFQLQSDSMEIQKNLADFYLVELNLKNEALKIYQKITESNQEDIETLLISGNINVSLQRLDEAELLYEKVLEIDPSNAEANQNLKAVRQHRLATNEIPANNHKGHNKNDKKDRLNSLQDQKEPHKRNRIDRQKASIVINLKGLQSQIEMCVNSIQQHTLPDNYEILLVDNNAGEERLTWAQQVCQKNPCCRIIEPLQGQGAANIWNSAVEFAAYEVMALLPNDSVVPEHWLSDLLECMNSMSGVGPVGSMSNRTGGIQQDSNAENLDSESFLDYAKNFRKENRHRRIAGVEALSPACVIFRKKLLNRIGEFDSNFKTETLLIEDFCRRSALMGHLNVIAGDVLVYQSHSQTNKSNESDSDEIITIDRQVYAEKWNGFDAGGIVEREIRIQKLIVVAETGFQRGLVNQATETLLNGIGAYPDEKKIYLALAEGLVNYGQYQNALDVLNGMPDIEAENDSQRQGIAVSAIIQKPNANPNRCLWFNPEIKKIELMGYCHQGLDDLAKADHLADQILALSPNSAFAFNLKGMIAYKNNDPQSAQSLFEKAIATDPGYAEAYTNLGVILWDMEKPDDALGSFQRGFVLYPVDIDIAAAYHSAISELGHFHQAERFIRSAAGLYPHSKNIQYLFIDVLIQQNKTQAAMEKIEAAVTEFGVDDGILSSAVKIRESLGPMEIDKSDLSRPSVSLCMIVKNEEKYLAGCLNSVKPIVDEMIVVDTGSDDATKDIAQAFGAKVYDFKWSDDFAEARNYSLSKASGDWILIMDADEIISPIDYNLFAELVHLPRETPVAYSINTRNYTNLANNVGWMPNDGAYFQEQAGIGWLPSAKVRLYYRGESNIRFEGAVHEMLDPSLKRQGVEIETCSIQIHHYDRLYKERFDKKKEIYYQIGRKKLEEIGDDIVALKELAVQATNMEKNEEAIELWGRFIALKPEKLLLSEAYVNLCTIYARLGDFEKALKLSMRAVKMCPNMKEAQYNLAMAQLHTGNANEAVSLFRKLTRLHPNYYIAKFSLTAAYGCAGKMDEFVTNLEQIKNTAMGKTIGYTFAELIKVLHRAHQREYALNLTRYSIESGIVNKDLFSLYSQVLENRQSNISDTKNQNRPTEINHQQKISNHVTM